MNLEKENYKLNKNNISLKEKVKELKGKNYLRLWNITVTIVAIAAMIFFTYLVYWLYPNALNAILI